MINDIPTIVIGCDEIGRKQKTMSHLKAHGVDPIYWRGIHGSTWGISTKKHSDTYPDGTKWYMSQGQTSLVINHVAVYQFCLLNGYEHVVILEDDAFLPNGWQEKFKDMWERLPKDYDLVYLGWLHQEHERKFEKVDGILHNNVNDCIFGTHALLVSKEGLRKLFNTNQIAHKHIDIQIYERSLPLMKYFVCHPSIITQRTKNGNWKGSL